MRKKGLEEDFVLLGAGNVNRWEQQRGAAGVHPPVLTVAFGAHRCREVRVFVFFFRGGMEVRVCAQVLPNLIRVRAVNGYTARVRDGGVGGGFPCFHTWEVALSP